MITGPTILTILRMVLAIVFVVFACLPEFWAHVVALVVFVVAAVTDQIDGHWARKQKIVTDLGAFLDPLADKMLVNLAFLVLTVSGIVPLWVFAVILVRDFAVDGMRMMAARTGATISASILGKLKTISQMTALIIILANLIFVQEPLAIIGNIVLYFALFLTVLSGVDYLIKGWKKVIAKSS
ncbi:CDP-diacylglycerol--glycerol-3-phosphate 3-phosphatidyltransferase [Candidatus Saccharibacteria bacterium]|nr:CDP-diacylglycerol--glycerol-3-phosphate 3-phosphatidyltransferase [Candidatus Saccharibacteria bacterium]